MDKKTIMIALDYLAGPIWDSDIQTGEPLTGIDVIDSDEELIQLNLKCRKGCKDGSCWLLVKQVMMKEPLK